MNDESHAVLILGSNVGDRLQTLGRAVTRLGNAGRITACSAIYETEPVGYESQDDFLNMALCLRTTLSPERLMHEILQVELQLGRTRSTRWGPRTIDVDIVFFDERTINQPGLTIPHPHYADRRFVLIPLMDIVPDWICPVRHRTVRELCASASDAHRVVRTKQTLQHVACVPNLSTP
jgi:2-amino-4-hydroxy-6-hydroxymethyldihydropteridine diphosphokinase